MDKIRKPKTALVIGASSDLGVAITKKLLEENVAVVGHYFSNASRLESISHPNLYTEQADLSHDTGMQFLFNRAGEKLTHVDLVVHMVGPFCEAEILTYPPEEWRKTIESNLNMAYATAYTARQLLESSRGHLIFFSYSGVESIRAWTMATPYAAAKAGLAILVKSLAAALAPKSVRVNAICPGYIDADHFDSLTRENIAKKIPQGRLGRADEVADVVSWLALQSPSYVNGALIPISGAWEP